MKQHTIANRCIEVRPPAHICREWNTTWGSRLRAGSPFGSKRQSQWKKNSGEQLFSPGSKDCILFALRVPGIEPWRGRRQILPLGYSHRPRRIWSTWPRNTDRLWHQGFSLVQRRTIVCPVCLVCSREGGIAGQVACRSLLAFIVSPFLSSLVSSNE